MSGDLKPSNILLDASANVKIGDFGLSNCIKDNGQKMNSDVGTPLYMCPELISMREYEGAEADVWSIGVILFQMVCGFLPFDDTIKPRVQRKICRGFFLLPDYISDRKWSLHRFTATAF